MIQAFEAGSSRRAESVVAPDVLCSAQMPKVTNTGAAAETLRLEDESVGSFVSIAPARGGMVTRFSVGGVPVLFLDESTLLDATKNVRGGIPVLFPIAGKLPGDRYHVDGRSFAMKQHGFARGLPWSVLDESDDDGACVTLGLEPSDATRVQYPFEFSLRFTYRLRGGALRIEQRFENRGDAPMPVQPGLHPYFFVPDAAKAGAYVDTDATRAYDNVSGREIAVTGPIEFSNREVDLHLLDHHLRDMVLHRPGLPGVELRMGDDQKTLVLWTLSGRDFICVEPWRMEFGALARGTAPRIEPGGFCVSTLTLSLSPPS